MNAEQTSNSTQASAPNPNQNPGHTLGIVSLITSIVGVHLVGVITGIIGLNQSKKAGLGNGLALAGLIVGGVGLVISTIFWAFVIFVAINDSDFFNQTQYSSNSSQEKANSSALVGSIEAIGPPLLSAETSTHFSGFAEELSVYISVSELPTSSQFNQALTQIAAYNEDKQYSSVILHLVDTNGDDMDFTLLLDESGVIYDPYLGGAAIGMNDLSVWVGTETWR